MALKNSNMNMADGGSIRDRSKLRMQKLQKAEPKQPERRMQKLQKAEPKQTKSIDQSGMASFLQNTGRNMARGALPGATLGAAATRRTGSGTALPNPGAGTPATPSVGTGRAATHPVIKRPATGTANLVKRRKAPIEPPKPVQPRTSTMKKDPWNEPW